MKLSFLCLLLDRLSVPLLLNEVLSHLVDCLVGILASCQASSLRNRRSKAAIHDLGDVTICLLHLPRVKVGSRYARILSRVQDLPPSLRMEVAWLGSNDALQHFNPIPEVSIFILEVEVLILELLPLVLETRHGLSLLLNARVELLHHRHRFCELLAESPVVESAENWRRVRDRLLLLVLHF